MKSIYYLLCLLSIAGNIVIAMEQENKIVLSPSHISSFIKLINKYESFQAASPHIRKLGEKDPSWDSILKDEHCCSSLIDHASRIKGAKPEFIGVFMGTLGAIKWLQSYVDDNNEALENLKGFLVDMAHWSNWKRDKNLNCSMARIIFGLGVSLNAVDNNISPVPGSSAVVAAATYGNRSYLRFLIKSGAGTETISTMSGRTALMEASFYGYSKMVKYLIEQGALVNVSDFFGQNALTLAIQRKHSRIVKYLIKGGAYFKECSQNELIYIGKILNNKKRKCKNAWKWTKKTFNK